MYSFSQCKSTVTLKNCFLYYVEPLWFEAHIPLLFEDKLSMFFLTYHDAETHAQLIKLFTEHCGEGYVH